MRKAKRGYAAPALEQVAGNGLLHRRALLGGGIAFAGALAPAPRRPAPRRNRCKSPNGVWNPVT